MPMSKGKAGKRGPDDAVRESGGAGGGATGATKKNAAARPSTNVDMKDAAAA